MNNNGNLNPLWDIYSNFDSPLPEGVNSGLVRSNLNRLQPHQENHKSIFKKFMKQPFAKGQSSEDFDWESNTEYVAQVGNSPNLAINNFEITKENKEQLSNPNDLEKLTKELAKTSLGKEKIYFLESKVAKPKYEKDSTASNNTLLTSNRVVKDEPNNLKYIEETDSGNKDYDIPDEISFRNSKRHRVFEDIHMVITDPKNSFNFGRPSFSSISRKMSSLASKRNQNTQILKKIINDLRLLVPPTDLSDQHDIRKVTDHLIEIFNDELEYEEEMSSVLESTLTTLKMVSLKESQYIDSQKKDINSTKKFNSSNKKNDKGANDCSLLETAMNDNKDRYELDKDKLQKVISVDLRMQSILHNYKGFEVSSQITEHSKENIVKVLSELIELDSSKFKETYYKLVKYRENYILNTTSPYDLDTTKKYEKFQNGNIFKSDELLSYIYQKIPEVGQLMVDKASTNTEPKICLRTSFGESVSEYSGEAIPEELENPDKTDVQGNELNLLVNNRTFQFPTMDPAAVSENNLLYVEESDSIKDADFVSNLTKTKKETPCESDIRMAYLSNLKDIESPKTGLLDNMWAGDDPNKDKSLTN